MGAGTVTKTYIGPTVQDVLDSLYVAEGIEYEEVSHKVLCTGMVEVVVKPKA